MSENENSRNGREEKRKHGRRIDFGGKPHPPEYFIPPEAIPEPPPPTPDRVRATPKAKRGQK